MTYFFNHIIFDRKGWLLWSCLFYFLMTSDAFSQILVKDKARIAEVGTVKGRVLQYDADGMMTFLRKSGDTLVVDARDVLNTKIVRSLKMPEKGIVWHSAEFGLDWGKSNSSSPLSPYLYLESNHAYVLNRFLQPGLGLGYQLAGDFQVMPAFASLTGELYNRRVTPFYYTNIGYGFAWARHNDWGEYQKVSGGALAHIGGGLKIAGRGHVLYLKAGYRIQNIYAEKNTTFFWGGTGGYEHISRTIRKVYFGISFAF